MARFGRGIVEQLTNPAFGRGMFDLGQKIGGMPAQAREEKKKKSEKAALIDVENQLRQIVAVSSEAARAGNVDLISNQISSINEQLKTEDNDVKRQRLTDTYNLLTQSLSVARSVEETRESRNREVNVRKAIRGGDLSSADGNAVGITTARMKLSELLAAETDENRRSQIFNAMDKLDTQLQTVDATRAANNIADLTKAEDLYRRLESKSDSRASIIANADPESDEYLRAKNESAAMLGIKQRIDQLREDPDTVRAVKNQRSTQRLADLTQKNKIQAAEETQAIAILSSLDPKSDKYKTERQRLENNNLGEAVKKVERAAQEVETAQLNLEKLRGDVKPTPLTKEQKALGERYGVRFQEGTSREIILANKEILKSTLMQVSKMGTKLALRDMQPLDEPGARATVQNILYDLKEQGDLSFAKDFLMTDLEDELREMSSEDQEYLINSVVNETPEEAEQIVLKFVQRKFPKAFEATETEINKEEAERVARQEAINRVLIENPGLDKNNPVDVRMAEIAVEQELRNIREGKVVENVLKGSLI